MNSIAFIGLFNECYCSYYYATNRQVAGSIPDDFFGIFK